MMLFKLIVIESADDHLSMNPAEAAILSSTVQGAMQLSLKAHFLSEFPDISHMSSSLTYLNLSYNCFEVRINRIRISSLFTILSSSYSSSIVSIIHPYTTICMHNMYVHV